MGVFNFIETIFFISLGITFVLILLLVYHFKQRISVIEQKTDTMLEIINNIVKEIYILKNSQHIASRMFTHEEPAVKQATLTVPVTFTPSHFEKINVSEIDSESDDNDEDSDEDDSDTEDDESMPDLAPITFEVDEAVKVINVSLSELTAVVEDETEQLGEGETEQLGEDESEPVVEDDNQLVSEELSEINTETIHVEKIESENLEETSDDSQSQKESAKEVYRKMTLQSLKTLVITKGLCSDPSKLKKNDLLKMLEGVDE